MGQGGGEGGSVQDPFDFDADPDPGHENFFKI